MHLLNSEPKPQQMFLLFTLLTHSSAFLWSSGSAFVHPSLVLFPWSSSSPPFSPCLFKLYLSLLFFLRETNLKVRQALPVTGDLGDDIEKLADFNGKSAKNKQNKNVVPSMQRGFDIGFAILKPPAHPVSPSRRGTLWTPQQPARPLHRHTNVCWSEIFAGQWEDPAARLHPEEHRVVLRPGAVWRWGEQSGCHFYMIICIWRTSCEVWLCSLGPETKLMQNCGKSTFKRTSIDRLMNILVLCVSPPLCSICAFSGHFSIAELLKLCELYKGFFFKMPSSPNAFIYLEWLIDRINLLQYIHW